MLPRYESTTPTAHLGQVAAMADGCLGMMALGAKEVTGDDKFKLGKAYTLRKLADLEALGVTSENSEHSTATSRVLRRGRRRNGALADGLCRERDLRPTHSTKDNAPPEPWPCSRRRTAKSAVWSLSRLGRSLRTDDHRGLDADVFAALPKASSWATGPRTRCVRQSSRWSRATAYAGDPQLKDLTETEYNRARRGARRHRGLVEERRDGCRRRAHRRLGRPAENPAACATVCAPAADLLQLGGRAAELADLETISDRLYHLPHVRRQGRYFITDDNAATTPEDDFTAR